MGRPGIISAPTYSSSGVFMMTMELWYLLGFAAWAVILVAIIGIWRVIQVLTGRVAANGFPAGQPHGGEAYWRLNRAHMNTLENLPIVATFILVAAMAGISTEATANLAGVILGARILQSLIHVASGSVLAVNLRFAAYLIQLLALVGFGLEIVRA